MPIVSIIEVMDLISKSILVISIDTFDIDPKRTQFFFDMLITPIDIINAVD